MRHDPYDVGRSVGDGPGHVKPTFESETQAAYDPATLAPDTETVAYDFDTDGTADFTRVIDRSQDNLGRDTGWQLKDGSTVENQAIYAYGATDGRLASVGNGVETFTYGYTPDSSLPATVTGPAHTVTNTWEATRNTLASKENEVGSTLVSDYSYSVNAIGQRTNVAKTGSAFGSARDIAWSYDALGQIISADSTIPGLDRGYRYDMIGNRLKSSDGTTDPDDPSATAYTANALNQYSAINSLTTSHDDDGNMTSGPLPANLSANSTLVWDGENRLIQAQVSGGGTVTYLYDAQSRRIAETVGSATTVYVYDGWNPIAEYTGSVGVPPTLSKTYLWGLDLSGSMQGAGGVGGLLAVTDGTGTYFPTYDGNGNITEYLDASGAVVAHYEYDPFGRSTVATGSKAQDFAHRFSTKPLDATTGLYYYGYRFYDPVTGRWPSRDPIGERGGVNLYGFVGNDSMNKIDILGMATANISDEEEEYALEFAGDTWDIRNSDKLIKALTKLWPQVAAAMALKTSNLYQVTSIYELDCECDGGTNDGCEEDVKVAFAVLPENASGLDSRYNTPFGQPILGWNHYHQWPAAYQDRIMTQASMIAAGTAKLICKEFCNGKKVHFELDYKAGGGVSQIYK